MIAPLMRRRGFSLLFAVIQLAGAAQLLVLPPVEGFDETAHYSYIREIADTHLPSLWPQHDRDDRRRISLLGVGLLTKAFFLPIGTGVFLYLICRSMVV
jgi:hypothetical protein